MAVFTELGWPEPAHEINVPGDVGESVRSRSLGSRWTLAAIYSVGLAVASILPSPLKRHPSWKYVGPDKFLHLVGYAGYTVTLASAFRESRRTRREAALLAMCGSTGVGLATGRLQRRVPGRVSETTDLVAGLIGSLIAVTWWYLVTGRETGNRRYP